MFGYRVVVGLYLTGSLLVAQEGARLELARLSTGAAVSFLRAADGSWGTEIRGSSTPRIAQPKPVRLEVLRTEDDIRQLVVGYASVRRSATGGVDATAEVALDSGVVFHVADRWQVQGAVLTVRRKVEVTGSASGGFLSGVEFAVDPATTWGDISFLAPGLLYGDPTYDGERSPGGTLNHAARRLLMREDYLAAPLFGLSFRNGASVSVLDPVPNGDTTVEESRLTKAVMTDGRFQFGALGAWQNDGAAVEFGFRFPGTISDHGGFRNTPPKLRWVRRYHPIEPGVVHSYEVSFRFGEKESFRDLTRNAWRWAWTTLQPKVKSIDVDQMRRVLVDHLQSQAATIEGRTAIPFVMSTVVDQRQWNWTMAGMGFVAKNIECADQLLREGDRDQTERGRRMRETGLAVIASMIQALSTVPLQGTGYDLATGKPWDHIWLAPWLRNATEDMCVLVRAYRRECGLGRQHPEWLAWVKRYVDWLVLQQREDGSFPRRWKAGTSEVAEPTGTTSYAPVPLLVLMSEETGDARYRQSAVRAAEYVWSNWGEHGLFIGGASDNPNATDKEAGMLSMEAFLSLYGATKEKKWLDRAQAAANFAESWIWIWNLPMPADSDDAHLHWKKGVSTIGVQGITAMAAGGADEYLDWAVPSYARLYKLTGDRHYLEVARVLLHGTKSMVAMPGRLYDMKGPGWQQEGWRMGPGGGGRGVGGHRFWLPWITSNHLYGINGLEELDRALYVELCR